MKTKLVMKHFSVFIIGLLLLFMPIAAYAATSSNSSSDNVSYTHSQIDSLVSVEVHRQVDTQLINLKIDKAANNLLEKYIAEQSVIQERHDYFMGVLITILVAVVGIVVPLKMDRDREKKIKRIERESNKMVSVAKEVKFSIALTRALNNQDADVRIFALSQIIKEYNENPHVSYAYNCRGCEYDEKGGHEDAIADYTKAIMLKSDFAEAYSNRGIANCIIEEYDKAMDDYSRAIELNPDYAVAYNNRAELFMTKMMFEEAEDDLNKSIKINPYSDNAYCKLASVLMLRGNNEDALQNVNMAIELNVKGWFGYYLRSKILVNLEHYKEASADAKMSLEKVKRKEDEDLVKLMEDNLEYVEEAGKMAENCVKKDGEEKDADNKLYSEEDIKKIAALLREYEKDDNGEITKRKIYYENNPIDEDDGK